MPSYVFADPTFIKNARNADPQKIGEAIVKATESFERAKDGPSVAEILVSDAKRLKGRHPMYRVLEWNNEIAGHEYRLEQTRAVIRIIRIIDDDGDDTRRAFVNVRLAGGERSYFPTAVVSRNLDMQVAALHQAERDLQAFRVRYREFEELCAGAAELEGRAREIRVRLGQSAGASAAA